MQLNNGCAPNAAKTAQAPLLALVVDDDEDTASLLGVCLERDGFAVRIVSTLLDGRAVLATEPVAIVLADLHLPDGEGTSLFCAGRPASVQGAILVSGVHCDGYDQAGRLRLGFDAFVGKPIDRAGMMTTIRALVVAHLSETP